LSQIWCSTTSHWIHGIFKYFIIVKWFTTTVRISIILFLCANFSFFTFIVSWLHHTHLCFRLQLLFPIEKLSLLIKKLSKNYIDVILLLTRLFLRLMSPGKSNNYIFIKVVRSVFEYRASIGRSTFNCWAKSLHLVLAFLN